MPHDRFGNEVRVGDDVVIHGTVRSVTLSDGYCNISVETDELMYPGNEKSIIYLNSKQVDVVQDFEECGFE